MKSIKAIVAKKTIKFKVIESLEGLLKIKIETIFKAKDELSGYDYLLQRIPKILDGVNSVSLDYDNLIATISYDKNKVTEEFILKVLEEAKILIIDNLDYIEENYEKDLESVISKMESLLKDKIKNI
ncbi:MAG: hypothetical protein ACRDD2_06105 [Sarcina sp.]